MWAKLSDRWHAHRKVQRVSLEARGLYASALSYTSEYEQDGFVEDAWVAQLTLEDRPVIPFGLTPHSLRHTYCSLLIAQGEDLSTVAAQMRHADLSTTLRVYTHVMKHRRDSVADRLDAALSIAAEGAAPLAARGR